MQAANCPFRKTICKLGCNNGHQDQNANHQFSNCHAPSPFVEVYEKNNAVCHRLRANAHKLKTPPKCLKAAFFVPGQKGKRVCAGGFGKSAFLPQRQRFSE